MAEPVITQPLEVDDFSGGKTDNYIAGQINQFEDADNFLLKRYGMKGKLITRPGQNLFDDDYYRIPSSTRLCSMAELENQLFQMSGRNVYYVSSGWNTLTGPTTNPALSSGTASNYLSFARWNKHLLLVNDALSRPVKVFNDGSWRVRTLGLPEVSVSGITITPGAASTKSFIYAFIRSDEYTIGSVTFREVSATALKSVTNASDPATSANAITGIPVLSNGSTDNYNTSAIKVEIYRTKDNGSTFYKVGEVTNGTTSFNDTVGDATIEGGISLYTDGGTVDFDQAPPAKYVVVANDIAWYCHVQEGSSVYPNRVRQSIQSALYASPDEFYDDMEDEITGCGAIGIYPIIFCKNKIYRLEGFFNELGQNGFIKREISATVGCVSHRSIVTTNDGRLFFAGQDGFYFTNGFSVQKISSEFNTSYREIVLTETQKSRIYGAYDSFENRIWWGAQRDEASSDNDIVFVAHLEAPNNPFTTLSGGDDTENFSPASLLYYQGKMLRGDKDGYLFEFSDNILSDPKVDTTKTPDLWDRSTIIYDYRGPAFDFGSTKVRKWVPRIVVNADNVSNLTLRVFSNNDNSGIFNELSEIKYRGNSVWGDETLLWGDESLRWNYRAVISHWRRFPTPLRCIYKQIRLTNSYTDIESYETIGTASSDESLSTVTLDTADREWDANSVGYFISFSDDDYEREWPITSRTDTTLTVDDPAELLSTSSNRNWKIRGYKKNEILNLLSYVIDHAPLTMTQEPSRTAS